jgi:uncharacterized membrane protein HdeD (DUF308 family)
MAEFRDAVAAAGQRLTDRIGRFWWILLTRGIVAVLFGIAALFWPQKSLTLLVFLVGGYLVVDGLSGLLLALRSGDFGASLLQGLASTLAGAAVLLWPGITTSLLLAVLGVWALVQGGGLLLAGRNLRAEGEDGSLLVTVGALAVSWIIALVALVVGGLMIFIARRLKAVQERLQSVGGGRV